MFVKSQSAPPPNRQTLYSFLNDLGSHSEQNILLFCWPPKNIRYFLSQSVGMVWLSRSITTRNESLVQYFVLLRSPDGRLAVPAQCYKQYYTYYTCIYLCVYSVHGSKNKSPTVKTACIRMGIDILHVFMYAYYI